MNRLVVVGDPVEHSLSPLIHNAALDSMGLSDMYEYRKMRVERGGLEDFVAELRGGIIAGANVTIPHKVDVMAYMDRLTVQARTVGAVNTIYGEGGELVGDNTDCIGFLRSMEEEGIVLRGMKAMILGAGGGARAVLYALVDQGVREITLANRTPVTHTGIVDMMERHGKNLRLTDLDGAVEYLPEMDLVVNTTPVGMKGKHIRESVIPLDRVSSGTVVTDIVYIPVTTVFLKEAKNHGCRTVTGVGMLVHQGAAALERWTGRKVPLTVMRKTLMEYLDREGYDGK